ncbi:MAG: peptide chain release factor N(5)-glutamine methyltransferase [Desulfobacterales bacterium]
MCKSSPTVPQTRESTWTILKLLLWTTSYFESQKIESARASAEILLASTLGLDRIDLYLRHDRPMSMNELAQYKLMIKRRAKREPVAYIVGRKEFWSMDLAVTTDVLIPRPETECLVEQALSYMPRENSEKLWNILELGTGSGAIVLALASELRHHRYFASDLSQQALEVAKSNAVKHHLSHRICFFAGNWFDPLKNSPHKFDMIISNPPYVETAVIEKLEPEISCYEPRVALDGGKNGLDSLEFIIKQAPGFLNPEGLLILEIGYDQRAQIQSMAQKSGKFESVSFIKDYSGNDRVVILTRKL